MTWSADSEDAQPRLAQHVRELLGRSAQEPHRFGAFIDGDLCCVLTMRPQSIPYRWDIVTLSAGSARQSMSAEVATDIWASLLEFGIAVSGSLGAKRVFAVAPEGTPAVASLRSAGFETYTHQTLHTASGVACVAGSLPGFREQEASDVWSVHQLYHHVTPRPVQFAEALTSAAWDVPELTARERLLPSRRQVIQTVLETIDGIVAYSRITTGKRCARVDLLVEPAVRHVTAQFLSESLTLAGVQNEEIDIVIPEYALDLGSQLERLGFAFITERVALVRHTTAPAVVYERFAGPVVEGERVPKGVPSYFNIQAEACAGAPAMSVNPTGKRMER
ncbi:MAG: hypothetical protein M9890_10825 [Thermomicrobiales bacterium]|nr:hypothetical protein [Thermomicrobiales bacterium]